MAKKKVTLKSCIKQLGGFQEERVGHIEEVASALNAMYEGLGHKKFQALRDIAVANYKVIFPSKSMFDFLFAFADTSSMSVDAIEVAYYGRGCASYLNRCIKLAYNGATTMKTINSVIAKCVKGMSEKPLKKFLGIPDTPPRPKKPQHMRGIEKDEKGVPVGVLSGGARFYATKKQLKEFSSSMAKWEKNK